jgi:hypothetical protein
MVQCRYGVLVHMHLEALRMYGERCSHMCSSFLTRTRFAAPAKVDLHALAACPQLSQLHLQRVGLLQPHGLAGMTSLASLVLLGCTQEHSIMLEVGRAVRELPVGAAGGWRLRQGLCLKPWGCCVLLGQLHAPAAWTVACLSLCWWVLLATSCLASHHAHASLCCWPFTGRGGPGCTAGRQQP